MILAVYINLHEGGLSRASIVKEKHWGESQARIAYT